MHGAKRNKADLADMPYIENYPPLKEWLDKHDARCIWQVPMQCEHNRHEDQPPTVYIEKWFFPKTKRFVVIEVHARKFGWEVYIANDSNDVVKTIAQAETLMGLS